MKEQEFSFSSLIKPGEGTKQAIERELELRAARERKRPWKKSWLYRGPASLLLNHGAYMPGALRPPEYDHLRGEEQHCHHNALGACLEDDSLRYFTGLYLVGNKVSEHSWCVTQGNVVVEVTFAMPSEIETGAMVAETETGQPSNYYMGPDHWAYWGVEFTTEFVARFLDVQDWLPILDFDMPDAIEPVMAHGYRKTGVPL